MPYNISCRCGRYERNTKPQGRGKKLISGCGSAWLERLVWDQEVAGSNPVTPTTCGCSSMVEHQPSKLDTWVRFPSPASSKRMYMREWLRGGVQPCQGWGRGFESRLALFLLPKFLHRNFGFLFFQKLFYQRKEFL